ncbi:hypothetical protein BJ138DRAFT_796150 [Hygrophoropsis aurantiaca]|uniref:Uncharacterized protein n=1 Tax=Hygrophoropsis aurantiaca TaxID=72124 RepID=A0ACB7ZVM0_9AGAM|nr:hypothetical protein BJ138DRAFT_796150 [Hygrophoropsis aurantiaca]
MSSMNCQNGTCTNRGVGDGPSPVRFMKCARCKKVSYCSKACQIEHWKAHRPICKELKNSVALPDMDNNLSRLDELRLAFEGRHAPPEQRLVRMSLTDSDSDSRKAAKFAASLDQQDVTQYALEKCLETGDRGAVVFNIKYPYMDTPTFSRLYWIPRQSFVSTLHPTISKAIPPKAAESCLCYHHKTIDRRKSGALRFATPYHKIIRFGTEYKS